MSVMTVSSSPDSVAETEVPSRTATPARHPDVAVVGAAVLAGLVVLWLLLRPSPSRGVAAEIDLLVLPALLFAEVRLLLGRRISLSPAVLAVFFGLGAVLAPLGVLLVERLLQATLGPSAAYAVGPLVETLAPAAPLLAFALLLPGGRRLTVADAALAGLVSGLGFLLVQSALVTAARHAGPDYVSPLLAGFLQVPSAPGSPAVFFVGPALATALVGLGVGIGVRCRDRAWRLLPVVAALVLVVFDRGLFDWRLRRFSASEYADPSGVVEFAQQLTLHGWLAPVLLAGGLALARREVGPGAAASGSGEHGREEEVADPGPATGHRSAVREAARHVGTPTPAVTTEGSAVAPPHPHPDADAVAVAPRDRVQYLALVLGVPAVAGLVLVRLAHARLLDVLRDRPLALTVSLLGLLYSLWCLRGVLGSTPEGRPGTEATGLRDGRRLLCVAAVASAGVGVLWTFLPDAGAEAPRHGALLVDAALGWAGQVGNLGVVLGLGGLTAPAPAYSRRTAGRWGLPAWQARLSRGGFRWGKGFSARWSSGSPGGASRTSRHSAGASSRSGAWWHRPARDRARGDGPIGNPVEAGGGSREHGTTLTLEPIYQAPRRAEASGATVKEAIQSALRQLDLDLAHASLQLLDEGGAAVAGKGGGPGRPARVRVTAHRAEGEVFLAPGRDSITRDTPFTVALHMSATDKKEPPASIDVLLTSLPADGSTSRTLRCAREESPEGTARYRSNPYTVDGGEDTTWSDDSWWAQGAEAEGIQVENGSRIEVSYRRERATITVYDSWAHQAVAVNRRLVEVTAAHHEGALAQLEQLRTEPEGAEDERLRHQAERLRVRLGYVEKARRVLGGPDAPGSAGFREDAAAFASTALLQMAMSFEQRYDDPDAAAENGLDAATEALRKHRLSEQSGGTTDEASGYRELLLQTVLGQLWTGGAYSDEEVGLLLGWDQAGRRATSGEEGFTLVEMLVTIVIMGIAFAIIVGGLGTAIIGADIQKQGAGADIVLRTAAEAIVYKPCAGPADYTPATQPAGFTVTVQSVSYWERVSDSFEPDCPDPDSPEPDSGLQLVELRAVSTGSPRPTDETLRVVKRKP